MLPTVGERDGDVGMAPATTWLLVSTLPSAVRRRRCPPRRPEQVTEMSTVLGVVLAAAAAMLPDAAAIGAAEVGPTA